MPDVSIVGGGVLGMTMALRLAQQGHAVRVFEGESRMGGLASADAIGAYEWDRFYHVILLSDQALVSLLKEIGLEDRLRWGVTRTGFYVDGRWISMSTALEFLSFPPLSLWDKGRLAATILRAAHIGDPAPLEETTALDWLERWSGRRTVERIWAPLLRSKLGDHARDASAAFIWAIIARMYAARRTGLKREMMGYVEGGYASVLPPLRRHMEAAGVTVVTGDPVTRVVADGERVMLDTASGERVTSANVVLTVSCPRIATLCPQLRDDERDRLGRVRYQGVVCPSFLLRRPVSSYYVTNITDSWVPFTGVIETTTLVDRSAFGGHSLVYLPRYLTADDPLWSAPDESIRDSFFAALQRMSPGLQASDVVASRVARAREVLAVSTRHYSRDALPTLRTSLRGVFVANSAQIAYGTLNVNESVLLAERQVKALQPLLQVAAEVPVHG